ncbi:hypothetical protein BDU57DRAFT_518738 [Ampelomyces quisqualis]|uniref:Uncharacterized protein n=1 Tax=Ampelomyces quisqualis TaxID=50730 RepID=A0A6A5QMG1_AMPQU|nr:hypothetical protein BDU57DRAFT_518738 [Ampelomyces quisqualis]
MLQMSLGFSPPLRHPTPIVLVVCILPIHMSALIPTYKAKNWTLWTPKASPPAYHLASHNIPHPKRLHPNPFTMPKPPCRGKR